MEVMKERGQNAAKPVFLVGQVLVPSRPTPNLSVLVSDETRRIWVSSQGWKPAVSSVYYGFYHYDKFQLRVETQPKIET